MRRLPTALWVLALVLVVVGVAISVGRGRTFEVVLFGLLALNLATVGALVLAHQPENRIGWVFLVFASYVAAQDVVVPSYALLAAEDGLRGGDVATWINSWSWAGEGAAWAVIAAVFPNGRLLGPRWRWVPWAAAVGALVGAVGVGFGSAYDDYYAGGVNPVDVDSAAVDSMLTIGSTILVLGVIGAAASLVVRFRRSQGVERQQLKWFALAACALAVMVAFAVVFWQVAPTLVDVGLGLTFNMIPLAAGVAILRYRLYDIDLVINRTLVYGALTAALVATYLVSVLAFRLVLDPVTGKSDLAVAVSTLAVAGLFRPLRSRIQGVVDRRFYRQHYDAVRTLDSFTGRLRQELDLETVSDDLRSVVQGTMQPAHVSLWLRDTGTAR